MTGSHVLDRNIHHQHVGVDGGYWREDEAVLCKITNITLANPAVVTFTVPSKFTRDRAVYPGAGTTPNGIITGVTGVDAAQVNATHVTTPITDFTCSIPIDTTGDTIVFVDAVISILRGDLMDKTVPHPTNKVKEFA